MGFLNILLIIFLAIPLAYLLYRFISDRNMKPIKIPLPPIAPENTIISFDLHDVLVRYDYIGIIKEFWSSKRKVGLFITILNPFLIYDALKLLYHGGIAEQFILVLPQEHPRLKPYIPLGIRIANCQIPVKPMLELVKKLKQSGYTIHLFSNIGAKIFQDLKEKLPGMFVDVDDVTLPSEKNEYIRKPFKNAFETYATKHKDKNIIFIDDKRRNIKTARSCGIIGILFKNHGLLTKELKKLGVLR